MLLLSVLAFPEVGRHEYYSPLPHRIAVGGVALEYIFGVYLGNQLAGKVQILQQGLYYRVICRCNISGDIICRLLVRCEEKCENLGILIPEGDGFGLDTKIPVKRLGKGEMHFFLKPKHECPEGTFTAIYPEEPFSYISFLKTAFLQRKEGEIGIYVAEKAGE